MARKARVSKLVRLLPRGRVTLPIEFRRQLQIDSDTILRLTLGESGIQLVPVREAPAEGRLRDYSPRQIDRFLREDHLDRATAEKVRRLLHRRDAV